MSLSESDLELLKRIYQRCDPTESLKPGDNRYVPIYERGLCEDPVSRLKAHIDFSPVESFQLFSGFRGSGKTTELFRLRARMENAGAVVLYANALDYLNPSEPVEISDLLMVIAGAFSDRLADQAGLDLRNESFWTRITDYLRKTSLRVTELTGAVEAASPAKDLLGGLNAGLEVKIALKEASSFRRRLREFLENRLTELKREVHAFIEQGVKTVREKQGKDVRVIFIFDQLEQFRGSASNEQEVIRSVERVFASHLDKLKLPYVHTVYTVPAWLQFVLPGGAEVEVLPSFRIWKNDPQRSRNEDGFKAMREFVRRRCQDEGFARLFGDPGGSGEHPLADRLIEASGGYFRDLLRLLREVVIRVTTQSQSLPVDEQIFDSAIKRVREQYANLSVEDAEWVQQVAETRSCSPRAATPEEAARITRLLDLHLVFYFSNGEEWYDAHPLVREEAATIVQRHRLSSASARRERPRRKPAS
jgi:predicted RNase H-like HicB family nuclease